MSERRSIQEWVHWFEEGRGARWVRVAGLAACVLLLSAVVGYKLFRGPLTETTMAQLVVGRQLAAGKGFSTPVIYPQTFAWATERSEAGTFVNVGHALPELHQPPLYSTVVAVALWAMPVRRMGADNALLVLNVALLWCAGMQSFFLARKLFGELCGVIASLGVLLSAPIWAATAAVNGAPLTMALWLALFQVILSAETELDNDDKQPAWVGVKHAPVWESAGLGVVCGLLFLSDYALVVVALYVCVMMRIRTPGWWFLRSLALFTVAFAIIAGPWLVRNGLLTGNLFAFAGHGIALKAGDPTADPAMWRALFTTAAPGFDVMKVGNKVLTALQHGFMERLWSGGGIFFTAFFVAGFAYRFRDARARRVRWLVTTLILWAALGQAFFDSGEGERTVWLCMAPLVIVFGAGFFLVLVRSNETLEARVLLAVIVLLGVQALPLARDMAEPRGAHTYNYPPYLPALFAGIGQKLSEGRVEPVAWMCDVPAGAAWYSGQRVWEQPATLDGFRRASNWEPVRALVLTPETLAKPFFGELTKPLSSSSSAATAAGVTNGGDWAAVYRGLATGRMPVGFPLSSTVQIAPDFWVLIDPGAGMGAGSGGDAAR